MSTVAEQVLAIDGNVVRAVSVTGLVTERVLVAVHAIPDPTDVYERPLGDMLPDENELT